MSDQVNELDKDRIVIAEAAAEIIRAKSKSGELASREEVLKDLVERRFISGDGDQTGDPMSTMEEALQHNEDLVRVHTATGEEFFFSCHFMTDTYAKMLAQKEGDLLMAIAEIVRENSAIYPRPVPLGAFTGTPFELTEEQIMDYMGQMGESGGYQDIKQTKSSIGTVFLYSDLHLEGSYASMLAEWIDVGQANNP
jgi:hypothetical protein